MAITKIRFLEGGLEMIGVILAGGKNSRMGTEKALLDFHGETMIRRQIRIMRTCCSEIVIVCNDKERYEAEVGIHSHVRVITDHTPHNGPLSGIVTALRDYRDASTLWIVSCDSPFIDPSIAIALRAKMDHEHASLAVPVIAQTPQLLHAVYRPSCGPAIEHQFECGNYKLMDLLHVVHHVAIEYPEESRFALDFDTPEDYAYMSEKGVH